jgi:hypothetical protein
MLIDIIVTTYNRVELFKQTMESFFIHTDVTGINQIVIADDGSTDGTNDYIAELVQRYPCTIVRSNISREHKGLVPLFNEALNACANGLVCELQDDLTFTAGWLEKQIFELQNRKVDFVTGYDAKEHKPFQVNREGHCVKHSTRFTQLLAYRETWNRWFPMLPDYDFPTPCTLPDGHCVGSNIDMKLSGMRKNDPCGQTKILVLPGLVDHKAERFNSTWRKDISETPRSKVFYNGGLQAGRVQVYWQQRALRQGDLAVGYAGLSETVQAAILVKKREFITQYLDTNLPTIDYGCGVGKFAPLFDGVNYVGLDLTKQFLDSARRNNPAKTFVLLTDPTLKTFSKFCTAYWKQFMTVNVLQHNCDATVFDIFKGLKRVVSDGFTISMYENTHEKKGLSHMCFRKPEDYVMFVGDHFNVKKYTVHDHIVHNEKHSLIQVYL